MIYVWHGPDSGEVDSDGWTHTEADILLDGSAWQLDVVHKGEEPNIDFYWTMDAAAFDDRGMDNFVHEWASFNQLIEEMLSPYWEEQ